MRIKIYPTVSPTSVLEQAQFLAETVGGSVATQIQPESVDVAVLFGPPNQVMDQINKVVSSRRKICYWVVEGILTKYGRHVARTSGCEISVVPSLAVKQYMEESDVFVDLIIPHEVRVPIPQNTEVKKMGVYIGGNYPRKFTNWALETLKLVKPAVDAYYRAEIPDAYAQPFNAILENYGVRRLNKMSKSELVELMSSYSAFVSLSAGEGFGLFQREALALGMNLVTVEHPAFWDILSHPCVYTVRPTARVFVNSNRNDVFEEFIMWNPSEFSEVVFKAIENKCTSPLKYEAHYRKFRAFI